MRSLLLLFFFWSTFCAYAQEHLFLPTWTKGDSRTFTIHSETIKYKNDSITEQEEERFDLNVTVTGADKESYTLKVLYDDVVLRMARPLFEMMDEEMKARKMQLIYKVDRTTGEAELMNWKEAQRFLQNSFEELRTMLSRKDENMVSLMNVMLAPVEQIFASKENLAAYMEEGIGFLFVPFNKPFVIDGTITTTETGENPFDPAQEMTMTEHVTLRSVDGSTQIATIEKTIDMDLSQFIEMMKNMMRQMAQGMGVDQESIDAKLKEADELDITMVNEQMVEFNISTSWVDRSVATATVEAVEPGKGKSRSETVVTVTAK